MNESKFVIVGGGMVAVYAARHLFELGLKSGELAIRSGDTYLPYERPPLWKGFLAGKISTEHGIEVRLGCPIEGVSALA
jgi:3-phenylpropionate/trans-cinnamate dioxygenase ferredoxin reductase subunit